MPTVGIAASHGGSAGCTSDLVARPLQRPLRSFKFPAILASVSASHATPPGLSLAPRFGPSLLPSQPDSDDIFPLPSGPEELQRAVIGWLEEKASRVRNLRKSTAEAGGQAQLTPRAGSLALEAQLTRAVTSAHAHLSRAQTSAGDGANRALTALTRRLDDAVTTVCQLHTSLSLPPLNNHRLSLLTDTQKHAACERQLERANFLLVSKAPSNHTPLLFPTPLSFSPHPSPFPHTPLSPSPPPTGLPVCQLHTSLALPLPGNRHLSLLTDTQKHAAWERQHERAADLLHSLCTEMRGFFLKAGQFLAKPDVSPPAWVAKLASLHDAAPADPFPVVCATIEGEMEAVTGRKGVKWTDVFARIDEEPLGSASIAQVHRAWLHDGRRVALKVQHRGAQPLMLTDLANLKAFGAFLQKTELKNMDIVSALVELEKQVRLEFDFRIEAAAMERVHLALRGGGKGGEMERRKSAAAGGAAGGAARGAEDEAVKSRGSAKQRRRGSKQQQSERSSHISSSFSPSTSSSSSSPVVVPRPVSGLVSRQLLVMDLIDGSPLLKVAEEMKDKAGGFFATRMKRSIFRSLGEAYGLMILRDGFFQADPHPGNILICPDRKVALLDYGQTKQISQQHRLQLAELILAVGDGDARKIGRLYNEMGFKLSKTAEENPESFKWMATLMFDTRSAKGATTSNPFSEEHAAQNNGVKKFPEDLFFVVRSMQLLRGICMGMGLNESLAEQWRPIARQAIREAQRQRQRQWGS
ncbi:unnamed protein product [Closterium sp. NIES-65]|nr:unnamed protein product [Closterium sp. NIES-65]